MIIGFTVNKQIPALTLLWAWGVVLSFLMIVEGIFLLIERKGWCCVVFEKEWITYKQQRFAVSSTALGYHGGSIWIIEALTMGMDLDFPRLILSLPFANEDFNVFIRKRHIRKLKKKLGYDIKKV